MMVPSNVRSAVVDARPETYKLVVVAWVSSVLPESVVEAKMAEEVALSMPIVEEPIIAPALKVMTDVVALSTNG